MKHADIRAMMAEVAPVIREYTAAALLPVTDRLDALEKRLDGLPRPRDGKDADEEAVVRRVRDGISDELAELRLTIEGIAEPVALPDIHALINEAIAAIPKPRDGLDAVEFLRDLDGHLIVTMSNGTTRDLGQVNGKDGEDGKPGRDGFGFDDMKAEYDGERTVTLVFTKGEHVERFPIVLPVVIDRGVFKDGETYTAGDGVTWGGSFWIAQEETGDKPDGGKGWRLAVKRGRDGKDGTLKPPSEPKPLKVG